MERALSALYEAALSPDHWPEAVMEVARVLGGGAAIVHAPHPRFANGQIWIHEADPETYWLAPPELLSPEHNPGLRAVLKAPGRMIDRRIFLPDDAMSWHPVSRQFFAPNQIRHMLIGLAHADEKVGSLFVLSRRDDQFAFDDHETQLAQTLADHVGRAMHLYRRLRLAEAQAMAFGMAIEHLSQGVLLVDSGLRILHANTTAETILAGEQGLSRWRQRLVLSDPHAQRTLETRVRHLAQGSSPGGNIKVSAMRLGGGRPFQITVQPAIGDAIAAISPRGRVLLFIDDLERDAESNSEALAKSFGLTPAEARVAWLLAEFGPGAKVLARELGISPTTVRTHLRRLFDKTGAHSQIALVGLLRGAAPRF